jgi:hypothetical protein
MSDLISRKAVINLLCKLRVDNVAVNGKRITELINELPTSYDVEKVAGEIEDVLWSCYIDNGQGFKTYVNHACEILKRGGEL